MGTHLLPALLPAHCLLLSSLHTAHDCVLPSRQHDSCSTTHHARLTTHDSRLTTHYALRTTHYARTLPTAGPRTVLRPGRLQGGRAARLGRSGQRGHQATARATAATARRRRRRWLRRERRGRRLRRGLRCGLRRLWRRRQTPRPAAAARQAGRAQLLPGAGRGRDCRRRGGAREACVPHRTDRPWGEPMLPARLLEAATPTRPACHPHV